MSIIIRERGTATSGYRNHPGRPGQCGGSEPSLVPGTHNYLDAVQALKRYTQFDYGPINQVLREPGREGYAPIVEQAKKDAASIHALIAIQNPSEAETVVYRGMTSDLFGVDGNQYAARVVNPDWSKLKGQEFVDKGFTSTTTSREVAQSWDKGIVAEIHIPAGTRYVLPSAVGAVGNDLEEEEIVLDRDTRFRIRDVTTWRNHAFGTDRPYFILDVVP